jgi:hypothetical protein
MTPEAYLRMRYASRLEVGEHTRITGGPRAWSGIVKTDDLPVRRFGRVETPLIVDEFFPYACTELDVLSDPRSADAAELRALLAV